MSTVMIAPDAPLAGAVTVTDHPPGERADDLRVGDVLLTGVTQRGIISRAIKLGAALHRQKFPAAYRRFSHAALVIDAEGTLAEALADGVCRNAISKYDEANYRIVRSHVDAHDQEQILAFAESVLEYRKPRCNKNRGFGYGYLTIAGLAIHCLTGSRICVQAADTAICSGFVADALTRAGFIWPEPPFAMMPADLAAYFKVRY